MYMGQQLDWVLARDVPKGRNPGRTLAKTLGEILRASQWSSQQEAGTLVSPQPGCFDLFRQRQPVTICCYSHKRFHGRYLVNPAA